MKKDEKTSHIPIILLTAKAGLENRLTGLKTGADDYLIKPFNVEELQVRMENLIQVRKLLQERYRHFTQQEPGQQAIATPQDAFLAKVTGIIKENFRDETFKLDVLYKELGMSSTQFYRKYQSLTGQLPREYLQECRLNHAHGLLTDTDQNVTEACYNSGFNNPDSFARAFRKHFGVSPSKIKQQ